MNYRALLPDLFAICMMVFGISLLVFPAMRVTGTVALVLGLTYWLLMAALKWLRL